MEGKDTSQRSGDRLIWDTEKERLFLAAVAAVEGAGEELKSRAVHEALEERGLTVTVAQVKSHLQKYKNKRKQQEMGTTVEKSSTASARGEGKKRKKKEAAEHISLPAQHSSGAQAKLGGVDEPFSKRQRAGRSEEVDYVGYTAVSDRMVPPPPARHHLPLSFCWENKRDISIEQCLDLVRGLKPPLPQSSPSLLSPPPYWEFE
eukprot:CAMPEP_0113892508 /NCGR_PEP_ID=MMETSP0780_2-20120614/15465_1 /TAXON_ID=652834 /ORGANISM="Palpitomonas bilix" /LENGTH=203 /DNA_ID=CAMNT_0000882473 /DNA_START=214 /DNA_END=825 /DNA_ORIENTATION=- /assembly_acc=CAM_ASM_000599